MRPASVSIGVVDSDDAARTTESAGGQIGGARWTRHASRARPGRQVSTRSRPRRRAAAAEAASPARASPSRARTRSNSQLPGLAAEWRWPAERARALTGACGAGRIDDRTRKSSTTIATTAATPSVPPTTRTAARDTRADENRLRRRRGGNSRRRSASLGSTGGLSDMRAEQRLRRMGASDGSPSDGNPASPSVSAGRATCGSGPCTGIVARQVRRSVVARRRLFHGLSYRRPIGEFDSILQPGAGRLPDLDTDTLHAKLLRSSPR